MVREVEFNINYYVKVRLTDAGRGILAKNHRSLFEVGANNVPMRPVEEDEKGWSEWQMWDLMSEFGPWIYNGCSIPFETTIKIVFEEK